MKKASALFLLSTLALTGCETTVEVDPPAHTPRLALSYTLSNQPLTADYREFFDDRNLYVSTSQGVFDTRNLTGRADATVELRDATGQVVEQFRPRGRTTYDLKDSVRGYYVPTRGYVGQPGQRYQLRASAPGVEPAEATLTLPAQPIIESASYVPKPTSPNGYQPYIGRLSFAVADNAATTDYYMAYARVLDANGKPWGQLRKDDNATTGDGTGTDFNRLELSYPTGNSDIYPLSDVGRNGQRLVSTTDIVLYYNGPYDPQNPAPPAPAFLEIIVSNLTRDTYDFFQSVLRYRDVKDNPFAEPAPLRSNITPGYGLFGGAADATFRIRL